MAEIILTTENFQKAVLESDRPVLVDFWASWCGPCQMIAPHVKELAEKYEGKFQVGKVNVDEEMTLAMQYQVVSIPTILIFSQGNIVKKIVGYVSKEELEQAMLEV